MAVLGGPDAIGPTAHYTAFVWARHGLSHPELTSAMGRVLYESARPPMLISGALGGPTLEHFLLARHRVIDHLLEEAISSGRVSQVLEVACGLSPRGWRFAERHGDAIAYVEADLPSMAERKRDALRRMGSLGDHHRVADIDALADEGPSSLGAVAADLDPDRGLAIVTEGLLNYLPRDAVNGLWRRIAHVLGRFPAGVYLSDIHLAGETIGAPARAFRWALGVLVRGRIHLHFESVPEAERELRGAGFESAALHRPRDFEGRVEMSGRGVDLVRVIEATA